MTVEIGREWNTGNDRLDILERVDFIDPSALSNIASFSTGWFPLSIYLHKPKDTTLERADSGEKEEQMFMIISFFQDFIGCCCPRSFKQGQAETLQTMKVQPNGPSSQLFLMSSLYIGR